MKSLFSPPKRLSTVSIYYDAQCHFCKRSVELIVKIFRVRTRVVGPAQSDPSIYAVMQDADSWVVTDEAGSVYTTFQAGVMIARSSPILRYFVPLARPQFMQRFGEWTYRFIARNRSRIWLP
jgi:predicted DCC family thiol-disulfide oxidoreductase YuxK